MGWQIDESSEEDGRDGRSWKQYLMIEDIPLMYIWDYKYSRSQDTQLGNSPSSVNLGMFFELSVIMSSVPNADRHTNQCCLLLSFVIKPSNCDLSTLNE